MTCGSGLATSLHLVCIVRSTFSNTITIYVHFNKYLFVSYSLTRVWIRWYETRCPTSVKIDTESCNIDDFIEIALKKERIELSSSRVVIEQDPYIRRAQPVGCLLEDNSDENPSVLCLDKDPTTVTARVNKIPLSISPSAYGKSSNSCKQKQTQSIGRIYQHWFSLEVYNAYLALDDSTAEEPVAVTLDGRCFTINRDRLAGFEADMKQVLRMRHQEYYFEDASICEVALTSLFCRCLDRFLFSDDDYRSRAFLHQMPTFSFQQHIHKTDFLVCSIEKGIPRNIILAGDYNLNDENVAYNETIGYCIESVNKYDCQQVVLGLSGSGNNFKLMLCQNNGEGQIQIIKMIETILEGRDLGKFGCILYACAHYLTEQPIRVHYPICEMAVQCDLGGVNDHQFQSKRVVKCVKSKQIHKFYDKEEFYQCEHNYQLILDLNLLPKPSLRKLDPNGRFYQLNYNYLEPTNRRANIHDFVPLLMMLSKLHEKGLVHSDVRLANIVFTEDGAHLIDFDMVDVEGKQYPQDYNGSIGQRHPEATKYGRRSKEHDRFSIKQCISDKLLNLPVEVGKEFDAGASLSDIAETIKGIGPQ